MPSTYTPIATQTLGSAASSVTFSSIPATYTDIVIVTSVKFNSGGTNGTVQFQFNGDTASNYSFTYLNGDGSAATSGRGSSATVGVVGQGSSSSGSSFANGIAQIQNYSNATTYKTVLARANDASTTVQAWVSMWRNTAAVTSILLNGPYQFAAGSTFTLYGVKSA